MSNTQARMHHTSNTVAVVIAIGAGAIVLLIGLMLFAGVALLAWSGTESSTTTGPVQDRPAIEQPSD